MRSRILSIALVACLTSAALRAELSGDDYLGGGTIQDATERAQVQALIHAERQREAGSETRDLPIRDAETAGLGLDESERANDTGQTQNPTHQPGASESRAKPPPLGLCDGS